MSPRCGRTLVSREAGQALPLMVALMFSVCLLLWQVGRLGTDVVSAARLQASADAVALAGASAGRGEAEHLAVANGVRLLGYRELSTSVQVTVVSGQRQATATAWVAPVDVG